jgi:hypothetical protein
MGAPNKILQIFSTIEKTKQYPKVINYFNTLLPNDNLNMFKDCNFQITNRFNTSSWNSDPIYFKTPYFVYFLFLF